MHVAPRKLFENVIVVQYIGLVGVTLLTLFGFQATFGNVLTRANLEVLAMNMVFEGIMALGMTFVIIMGGIDLSVASVFAFCRDPGRQTDGPGRFRHRLRPFLSRLSQPPPSGP